jgi:CheY-like chemotaxis protein
MDTQKILIVDDDPDFVMAVEAVLLEAGYEVAFAYDRKSGLEKLAQYEPDLLILDAMMPVGTEGFTASYEIRKNPKFTRLPILMISSIASRHPHMFSQPKDEPYLPIERFVEKPVQPEQLLKEVQNLLADQTPAGK